MKKIAILLAMVLFAGMQVMWAQNTITGKVTDVNGSTLPGATVRAAGFSGVGTVTDMDGNYSLEVPQEATNLVFSFVGMKENTVAINGQSVVNATLEAEDIGLEEVVVTAVGIKRDQKALGYSVQTVSNDALTESNNTDIVNAISGRTAGVQVNSSGGTAGASTYITIRGAASLTGNNQPLFIIDGMPIITGGGGGVAGVATSGRSIDINPEDIASMTVLKGGAATALYGIQAANGAIVITTKKGNSKSALDVSFSSVFAIDQISQTPPMQQTFAQGTGGNWASGSSMTWGPRIDESVYFPNENYIYDRGNEIVPLADHVGEGLLPAEAFDQYDFFQLGKTFDNNVSIASGSENLKYYFSIGNRTQTGIIPNNEFARTSVKLNAETNLTPKLNASTNMTFVNSNANFIQQGSNTSGVMLGLLRSPPSFQNGDGTSDDPTFWKFPDGNERTYRNGGGYDNPYWTANENYYADDVNRFMGNSILKYKATDWLTITMNNGIDWYNRRYTDYIAINSRTSPAGQLIEYSYYGRVINSDIFANISKRLTDDLGVNVILGHNLYGSYGKSVSGQASGLAIPEFVQLSNTSDQTVGTAMSNYRTEAVFADVSIDFMNMVYLGLTGRNDWATTMPEENLSAFYPSANLSFIFTEIPGLQGNNIITFGKLRASYAKTANIADAYSTTNYFAQASTGDGWTDGNLFPLMDNPGFTVGMVMGNSTLNHETQTTYEFGVDLRFLDNKLTIDASYFHNFNTDLLLSVPIARSTGFSYMYMNAASMESYGYELSLGITPVKTKNFTWNVLVNFTQMENPVTELAEGVPNVFLGGFTDPQIRAVAGEEYRSIYGYDYYRYDANGDGITTLDEPLLINDDPTDGYPDGFPMTDERAMVSLGTVNPDWTGNMTHSFSFKGIDFSFLIDVKKGGLMYNGTRFTMNYFGTSLETENREVTYLPSGAIDFENTPEENLVVYEGVLGHLDGNDEAVSTGADNNVIVVNDEAWYRGQGGNFGGGATSGAIEDAGWVRLRDVTLGYTLNQNVGPIKSLRVFVQGRNLFLSTPYNGIDPETNLQGADNAQGMDYFNMPGTKSYSVGLKIKF